MLADKNTERTATLTMTLKADSGYVCESKDRISPEQWGRIVAITNEEPK